MSDSMSDSMANAFETIAIVGMAGRFPGARDIDAFWENLVNGTCSLRRFTVADYEALGYDHALAGRADFIPVLGFLDDFEQFDSRFFRYSPREAGSIDPQQRIFLEMSWEALQDAGINPEQYQGLIGVFAGCGYNYANALQLLAAETNVMDMVDIQNFIGNEKDFLATRIAYKLNLRGPCLTVQSACSTSLLAVHIGVQNLLTFQCDIALCGGVSLQQPKIPGYLYKQGEILSPTGELRAFDAAANGTVFGEGGGVVVLKRLSEALEDNDHVYAVIRASAANNDGGVKAGYTAPSVRGQSEVIKLAIDVSGVNPGDISYIETHGTGTALGDLVELSALKEVFPSREPSKKCALGSVKANIGHLDAGAGVTGLIKTALALENKKIPLQVGVTRVNPQLELETSPFYLPSSSEDWICADGAKRYAGVSSFGVGGTNVHVILEEAPSIAQSSEDSRGRLFLPLAAHGPQALEARKRAFLSAGSIVNKGPRAIAFSLVRSGVNREYRGGLIADSISGTMRDAGITASGGKPEKIVFLFSGQGAQWTGMGRDLYRSEPAFREFFDEIAGIVLAKAGFDIRGVVFDAVTHDGLDLHATYLTQICLFSIEMALARLLNHYGIHPTHMLGHSLGEITAATISGVFTVEGAVGFILARGKALQHGPAGNMIAVMASEEIVREYCGDGVYLSVVNGPGQCVLSCLRSSTEALIGKLKRNGLSHVLLKSTVPFHTPFLSENLAEIEATLESTALCSPSIPFLSNLTGDWFVPEGSGRDYWLRHIVSPVQFARNVKTLAGLENAILIEVGPGRTLINLSRENFGSEIPFVQALRQEDASKGMSFSEILGELWIHGLPVDWNAIYGSGKENIVHLPPYAFESERFPAVKISGQSVSAPNDPLIVSLDAPNEAIPDAVPPVRSREEIALIVGAAWNAALGYRETDSEADFFSLGGDSILAAKIAMMLSKNLSMSISPSLVLSNPTIASLVDKIVSDKECNTVDSPLRAASEDMVSVPVPHAQRRLWFIHEFDKESIVFNLAQCVSIHGNLDREAFRSALDAIVARHDAFSLTFFAENGIPMLRRDKRGVIPLEFRDLAGEPDSRGAFSQIVRSRCGIPADLSIFPLCGMGLYKLGEDEHKFVLYIPHAITDGWSFNVFQRELEIAFGQAAKNKPIALPPKPFGYFDYALWEQARGTVSSQVSLGFWKEMIGDIPRVIDLPYSRARPEKLRYEGDLMYFSVPEQVSRTVKRYCAVAKVSAFHLLAATFGLVLHKYSGQEEIMLGVPDANRKTPEIGMMMGFFLNMLPLRIDYRAEQPFGEIVSGARKTFEQCLAHADIGYEGIVEALKLPRRININPIFQVMFAFQNYMDAPLGERGFRQEILNRGISEYDLSLYMWEDGERLSGAFEYSTELFEAPVVEGFMSAMLKFLNGLEELIPLPVASIPVLSQDAAESIFAEINRADAEYDRSRSVIHGFRESMSANPDKHAVSFEGQSLTYRELDRLSDAIAKALSAKGVVQGSLIGIHCERGLAMLVSMLGILKAGAAYVPLDPNFPRNRLVAMMEDAGLKHVITTDGTAPEWWGALTRPLDYRGLLSLGAEISGAVDIAHITPDMVMYVLYTSGSTGKPNGVRITHGAFTNFIQSMAVEPGMSAGDRMLALTTLSFDIAGLELFLPLYAGASLEIVSHETAIDGSELSDVIDRAGITMAQATPATWQALLESGWKGRPGLRALCGGEAVPVDLGRALTALGIELWIMYGPTETTVWSSVYRFLPESTESLIGHPIANTSFYVLDAGLNPVPRGVPGELYIGGEGVSIGYLNRPELNERRFIENPFDTSHPGKLYKTGDRVVYRGDGNLKFLERMDSQVKLRGFRIEIGDIETAARSCPGILDAVAVIQHYSDADRRLVLFVRVEGKADESEIKRHIATRVPDYMVPSRVIPLESFPMTPNGKISRRQLEEADFGASAAPAGRFGRVAVTEEEKAMAEIWSRVLGIESVGMDDNFFQLGGHSLLAVRLVAEMNGFFHRGWRLNVLFDHPTIARLLGREAQGSGGEIPLVFRLQSAMTGTPLFLIAGVYEEMYYKKGDESAYESDFLRYFNNAIVHLRMDVPIFGFRPRGIYHGERFHETVEDIAREYIEEIRKIQPHGPYLIGAECLGGIIAIELARQLSEAGERVQKLILMDTYKVTFYSRLAFRVTNQRRRLQRFIRQGIREVRALAAGHSPSDFFDSYRKVFFPLTRDDYSSRQLFLGSKIYANRLIEYKSRPLSIPTLLIINEEWNRANPSLGWSSRDFEEIEIHVVPGNHNTKLSTYGSRTGEIIRKAIL